MMWWEPFVMDLARGFLFSGLLLFTITLVTAGMSWGHDHTVDVTADHDISADMGVSVADKDFDHDHDFDHDIDTDHGTIATESSESSTPLMLMVSTFMLSFGFFGEMLFRLSMSSYIRIVTIIGATFLVTIAISYLWRKVAKSSLGNIVSSVVLIGRLAVVVHQTTRIGGSVRVEIGAPLGTTLLPARSRTPDISHERGEEVLIVGREGTTCIVDYIKQE